MHHRSVMAEDGDTYCQSGTADNVAAYPHGGETKEDSTYCHGGVAKDKATYCHGGTANNDARMQNICVILKKKSQTQSCDIVVLFQ